MASRSSQLFRTAQQYIPGGVNSPVRAFRNVDGEPFFVDRAKGAKIWDVDGNEYIDYVGSWGPAILGHAPNVVVDVIRETATRGVSFRNSQSARSRARPADLRLDAFDPRRCEWSTAEPKRP